MTNANERVAYHVGTVVIPFWSFHSLFDPDTRRAFIELVQIISLLEVIHKLVYSPHCDQYHIADFHHIGALTFSKKTNIHK